MKSGYCTIILEQKRSWGKRNEPPHRRDHGASEMNHHQLNQRLRCSSSNKGDVVYVVELEGSPLLWAPSGKPINSNKYCFRLEQLKALEKKHLELVNRKCMIFHQDTARLHVSLVTRQKLLQLGWEVLTHLPYSPNTVPLDFHLFWTLQNSLNGKNFNSLEDCKRHLKQFFAQKDKKFREGGIMKLPVK